MLGGYLPLMGAPVVAIVLGAALALAGASRRRTRRGTEWCSGPVLRGAVVLMGAGVSLGQVAEVGASSLPVMLGTVAVCLLAARLLGRRLGVDSDLTTLIGVGTAICGASAIAAASPVMRARHSQVAYAISTIFVFNVAAVLCFPPLGHLLHLDQEAFGVFAGTAINDASSVVAAGTVYGDVAAQHAVVVKLVRTLMIVPICVALGVLVARRTREAGHATRPQDVLRVVPVFILAFVVAATANSLGWIPTSAHQPIHDLATFGITLAMGAIGLSTDASALRRAGWRPLGLGAALWVVVSAASLLIQATL